MLFDFDPLKDQANREKHGIALAYGSLVFEGTYIEAEDVRRPYGETRFTAVGPIPPGGDKLYSVTYTWRGPTRRLISVRRASEKEARTYHGRHA